MVGPKESGCSGKKTSCPISFSVFLFGLDTMPSIYDITSVFKEGDYCRIMLRMGCGVQPLSSLTLTVTNGLRRRGGQETGPAVNL